MKQQLTNAWLYLSATGLSILGNAIITVVLPWLVLERTGDPVAAGVVATAIAVPSVLFALVGGHLIDIIGPKPMSIISDVISAASVVGLIAVDNIVGLTTSWFIALGIVGAIGDIPGAAARQSLAGDVARSSGKSIDWLAGTSQGLQGAGVLVGPALAGILMAVMPVSNVLIITAACSFLAAVLSMLLRLTAKDSPHHNDFAGWQAWRAALAYAPIRMLLVVAAGSQILIQPYLRVLLPAHFQSINAPALMGFAMSGLAVGMILSGGIIAVIGTQRRRLLWAVAITIFIVGFVCLALLQNTLFTFAGLAIAGVRQGLIGPLVTVLVTENVPEAIRGRTFAVFLAVNTVTAPIGLGLGTVALEFISIYQAALGCCLLWVPVGLWAIIAGMRVFPKRKNN